MTQTRVIFAASYKSCPACYHRSPNTQPVPPAEPCAGSPSPFGPSRSLTMSASRYRSRRNSGNTRQWRCTDTVSAADRQYSVGVQPSRDMNTLAGILHLLVWFGFVGFLLLYLCCPAFPSHHPPEALHGSCIPSFSHPRP